MPCISFAFLLLLFVALFAAGAEGDDDGGYNIHSEGGSAEIISMRTPASASTTALVGFPHGRSRGMSACPVESEGEGAGIISMRLPNQCLPNTGRIRFFPILSCPCDVKHIASLHGFAVFDEALSNCF